jgi:hypothetical protein
VVRIIAVAILSHHNLFAPLRNDAEGWADDAVNRLGRGRGAPKKNPCHQLYHPIFWDRGRNTLNQFLPVGSLRLCFARG